MEEFHIHVEANREKSTTELIHPWIFVYFSPHFSRKSSDKIIENPSVVMCTPLGDQTWFAGNFPI